MRAVKPLRVTDSGGVALDRDEIRALLAAVADHRLGAAVALLFLQGWRVSEVQGLAGADLAHDTGIAHVHRASVYVDGRGQQLGPPRTEGAPFLDLVRTPLLEHRGDGGLCCARASRR